MTEQEAEAFAVRLTRIWQPETSKWVEHAPGSLVYEAELGIDPYFEDHVYFYVFISEDVQPQDWAYQLFNPPLFLGKHAGSDCHFYEEDLHNSWFAWADPVQTFINLWMPTFRRGCWLSGCDIEASAHKKAEWMQGFTPEELQSWSLKM